MSVFRNYDPKAKGKVIKQAFPMVTPIPWVPTQRNIRANPNIPSQPQRIQPQERGTYFPGSSNGGGTLAVSMSSGCSSLGGCSGCGQSMASPDTAPTPSSVSTMHAFPSAHPSTPKRSTGALRKPISIHGTIGRSNVKARISMFGGR